MKDSMRGGLNQTFAHQKFTHFSTRRVNNIRKFVTIYEGRNIPRLPIYQSNSAYEWKETIIRRDAHCNKEQAHYSSKGLCKELGYYNKLL